MVKKSNGKWKICTDYIDLNKTYPKDTYPSSSIDRLVNNTMGYKLINFLDAYFGLNQISIYPPNEDKIALMIEGTNFCYKVMAFDLKKY